jgi:DHA2 family multidrug resistance protein
VGPVLGGWITDNISWPWIFYINIPVGLIAIAATWAVYRDRETPTARLPVDVIGLGLLMLWVGSLQVMLDRGKDLDWFASGQIVTLAIVAVIGFALFVVWELTDAHPVVDLRLFARRNYWTSSLAMSLAYGAFFGNVVLLPLWLQQYMGYTATMAGLVLAPVGLLAIVLTPFVGRTVDKVDPRIFATTAFLVFALVLWMRSRFNTQADLETLLIPTIIQGAAVAVFFIPLVTLSLSGLPASQIPSASGLFNFARITAGAFGTSITTTWWDTRAALHHAQLVERMTGYDPTTRQTLATLQAGGLSPDQSLAALNRMVDQQAYMLSANDIFYVSAILFLLLIGVVWLARPVKGAHASPEATTAH